MNLNLFILSTVVYLSSNCVVFKSSFVDYWFPYRIHLYIWSTQSVTVARHIHWFFKTNYSPMLFTIYHFDSIPWFPFSFHTWSAIPDFSISPRHIVFRCSCSLTFRRRHVLLLYTLLELYGGYTCNSWSCCIQLGTWLGRDIFEEFIPSFIVSW